MSNQSDEITCEQIGCDAQNVCYLSLKYKKNLKRLSIKYQIDMQEIQNIIQKIDNIENNDYQCLEQKNQLIKELYPKLIKNKFISELLPHLSQEDADELLQNLKYEFIPKFQNVYKQGELSQNFYVILEGIVLILKHDEGQEVNNFQAVSRDYILYEAEEMSLTRNRKSNQKDQMNKTQSRRLTTDEMNKTQSNRGLHFDQNPIAHLLSLNTEFIHKKTLNSGQTLGEISLMLGMNRQDNAIVAVDTHLVFVSEKLFNKLINPYFQKMIGSKIQLFKQNPIFNAIDMDNILSIIIELKQKQYQCGQYIYREGEKANHIYFVTNGQIQLEKSVENGQKSQKNDTTNTIPFSSYSDNSIFGCSDIFMKIPRYSSAIAVSPQTTVFQIPINKFLDNLGNYSVIQTLKQNSILLHSSHKKRYSQLLKQTTQVEITLDVNSPSQNRQVGKYLSDQISKHQEIRKFKLYEQFAKNNPSLPNLSSFQSEQGCIQYLIVKEKDRNVLQKIYCNSLQGHNNRILAFKELITNNEDTIRGVTTNNIDQSKQIENPKFKVLSTVGSPIQNDHVALSPRIENNNNIHESVNIIKPLVNQIGKLPRVQRDNLVLILLKQKASRGKNPKIEQGKIDLEFERVAQKIRPKKQKHSLAKAFSMDIRQWNSNLVKVLNIDEDVKQKLYENGFPMMRKQQSN